MVICPLCNEPHKDSPSPARKRICLKCFAASLTGEVPFKPTGKKRRSKQTPAPPVELPPVTEQ